jgi:pentatricopeptide repeat protein
MGQTLATSAPSQLSGAAPSSNGIGHKARRRIVTTGWLRLVRPSTITAAAAIAAAVVVSLTFWFAPNSGVLREAEDAYSKNNPTLALRLAYQHLKRHPASTDAALVAARSLSRLNRPDGAELYYRQAAALSHDDLHIRALGLVQGKQPEMAIQAYRDIVTRWPDDILALRRLGSVYLAERRNDETLAVADRLIGNPAGAVIGHTLKGVVYYNAKRHKQSLPEFERVMELDPELKLMPLKPRALFWIYLAEALVELGRPAEAREHLTRALQESDDPLIYNLLAHAYKAEGSPEKAEECWKEVVERDPRLAKPWHELGLLAIQRGDPEAAIPALERAAALAPEAPEPAYGLSLAYRRLGRHDEADRFHEEFSRLSRAAQPASPCPSAASGLQP